MSQDDTARKLAEVKTYLERRISELNKESATLSSFLEVIDTLLAEKSFRKVEIPKLETESVTRAPHEERKTLAERVPLLTSAGTKLGELIFDGNNLTAIPAGNVRFDVNSPPFRAFMIARVLEPMKARDAEMSREGKLRGKAFTYEVDQEDGILKALLMRNFGDEKRLLELKNAVRWTFRRMYEKRVAK